MATFIALAEKRFHQKYEGSWAWRNFYLYCTNYKTLEHIRIPSSCIVVMVHMVKGRQYSAYTVPHAGVSIAEMESV
jgi:hypothetical protein